MADTKHKLAKEATPTSAGLVNTTSAGSPRFVGRITAVRIA